MHVLGHHHWDIKSYPPKKNMVAGKLVLTSGGVFGGRLRAKSRRVAIEIRREEPAEPKKAEETPLLKGDEIKELGDDDRVVVRLLTPKKKGLFKHADHDDSSDDDDDDSHDEEGEDEDWKQYRIYDLDEIVDDEVDDDMFEGQLGRGNQTEVRQLKFRTKEEADEFAAELKKYRQMEKDRAQRKLEAFRAQQAKAAEKAAKAAKKKGDDSTKTRNFDISNETEVKLLVEIVSAVNLPIADIKSTDPLVAIYLGKDELHKTKHLPKTLDPIWTIETGSLFLLHLPVEKFFAAKSGLTFMVFDYDSMSKNELIAKVSVSHDKLLEANGERMELKLTEENPKDRKSRWIHPKLMIRVRKASDEDFAFIRKFKSVKNNAIGVYASSTLLAPKVTKANMLKRETKKGPDGTLYRVKPRPDPKREEETKWMTEKLIHAEALKPTYEWVEAGSGTLGYVYFEIIGCDGLPNKDGGVGGKSDAFCCAIYEDAIVNTNVINDCLSPRWMPWTQRAFKFRIGHPSSQIQVGVFDYDAETALADHDPMGRISIDITNYRANTEYLLHFNLYSSTLTDDRKVKGKILVRLRIQWHDYRKTVFASAVPPPDNYVNVNKKLDFQNAVFVTNGKDNPYQFDTNTIKAYVNELVQLQELVYYITEAAKTVLLWRGTFHFLGLALPMHSVTAFLMGITLIENFNLLPSYWLFSISWILLATMEQRGRHPSPWAHTYTFSSLWIALLTGTTFSGDIAAGENEAKIKAYNQAEEDRRRLAAEKAEEAAKRADEMNAFLADEDAENTGAEGTDIATSTPGKMSFNPLKPFLFPVQLMLGQLCVSLRIARSIVAWDEPYYAFMIVNVCLLVGVAVIWVPWHFIIRWTLRIVIWLVLGPWMKLVDIYYVQKIDQQQKAEKQQESALEAKGAAVVLAKRTRMMQKEEATKLRAFKKYMFGKYIVRVPRFKEYRFPDTPLSESTAVPMKKKEEEINVTSQAYGQLLTGAMVPKWGDMVPEEADGGETTSLRSAGVPSYGST